MIDSEGKAFHVKQQAGRPFVAAIKLPEGVKASHVFNRILRFTGEEGTRWRAIDASTGKLIGAIDIPREPSTARKMAKWISATKQLYTTE